MKIERSAAVGLAVAVGAVLLLGFSGQHHWDEYLYLFSVRDHGVAGLAAIEPGLGRGLFPDGLVTTRQVVSR